MGPRPQGPHPPGPRPPAPLLLVLAGGVILPCAVLRALFVTFARGRVLGCPLPLSFILKGTFPIPLLPSEEQGEYRCLSLLAAFPANGVGLELFALLFTRGGGASDCSFPLAMSPPPPGADSCCSEFFCAIFISSWKLTGGAGEAVLVASLGTGRPLMA